MGPLHDIEIRAELARMRVETLTAAGASRRIEEKGPARPAVAVLLRIRRRRARTAAESATACALAC